MKGKAKELENQHVPNSWITNVLPFWPLLFSTKMTVLNGIVTRAADSYQRSAPSGASADDFDASEYVFVGGGGSGAAGAQKIQAAENAAGSIRKQISAHLLERAVADVAIAGSGGDDAVEADEGTGDAGSAREEATTSILRCLDAALATVFVGTDGKKKGGKKNKKKTTSTDDDDAAAAAEEEEANNGAETTIVGEWSESVDYILHLVSALGCSTKQADATVARALMDRSALLSDVAPDAVRSYVCTFVGLCVHHLRRGMISTEDGGGTSFLLHAPNKSSDDIMDDGQDDWRLDCLDKAGSILLPRLTDKAQAVRCAAIRACSAFFVPASADSPSGNEDENESLLEIREAILDGLLGRMAHDPSFANRCAAIQSVPITEDTVPYLLERVGDVKEKVRVAALEVLRNRVDVVEDMTEEQRVDVLRFGLTSR